MKLNILKQVMMNKVLYSLLPIIIFSIYLFGWRVLSVIIFTNAVSYLTEWFMIRKKPNAKVSMAVFVTGTLLALTLPPSIPLWIAGVGAVVGVIFGKMVFGGFGANIFNPAIVGRTFIYISFPQAMTVKWLTPFSGFPGGFTRWGGGINSNLITSASPMSALSEGITEPLSNLFFGFIPGSMGETSALLIVVAAIYLIFTKTAKWQAMLSCLLAFVLFNALFNPENIVNNIFSGGILFGTVFMITDPISMSKTKQGIWIYGLIVGFLTVFIRKFSLFTEGFMFALLLGNTFMPIIDYLIQKSTSKKAKQVK